jgi:membrane fusion protein, macrolide-specific efflux system
MKRRSDNRFHPLMQKMFSRKTVAIAAGSLAAIILFGILIKDYFPGAKSQGVLTATVIRKDLISSVMTTGSLQAQQQVDVGARVSGQLKSLKVKLGDHVTKGQLLAEIDPVLAENELLLAKENLESLMAQRRAIAASQWQAGLILTRQQEMLTQDATSRQELESAKAQELSLEANYASLNAQINRAKTLVNSAMTNLEFTKITAPMDGDVVAIVTQEGQTVVAAQQAPVILKLANLDIMTVKAQISEADIIRIQPGQGAYFTILGDAAERHFGTVGKVEPAPQEFSKDNAKSMGPVFYNALFDVENPNHRLRIAMTAQVTIVLVEVKNALCIPLSALGRPGPDGHYPVRVRDRNGQISTAQVSPGINDRVWIQVEGLNEGDEVIIEDGTGNTAGNS